MNLTFIDVKVGKQTFPMLTVYKSMQVQINKDGVESMGLKSCTHLRAAKDGDILYLVPSKEVKYAQKISFQMGGTACLNNKEWNHAIGLKQGKYRLEFIKEKDLVCYKLIPITF